MRYKNRTYVFVISLCLLLELFFLYYIKYSNQNLSLSEFSFNNIGNIINLSVTLVLILGLVIYLTKDDSEVFLLVFILLLSILLEVILYISTLIEFPANDTYILGQEGDKLIDAAVFTVYYYIIFVFISIVWLKVFGQENIVLIKSLINGLIIIVFLLVATCIYINSEGNIENVKLKESKKNIAVVLGSAVWSDNQPSPSLAGRIEKAVNLYNDGLAGKIFLTGGNAPGEKTEADVAYEYAKRIGMEMSDVSLESSTTSTTEQVKFIKSNFADDKGIKDIILVSDEYHLVRVAEICSFFNMSIKVAASDLELNDKGKIYRQLRECIALTVFWCFAL